MNENNQDPRANLRQKAQKHFTSTEQRDADLRHELEHQRALFDAKSARLRTLRLQKEAAEAADNPNGLNSESGTEIRKTRTRRMKRITR